MTDEFSSMRTAVNAVTVNSLRVTDLKNCLIDAFSGGVLIVLLRSLTVYT
jgi:hypothetical protein